MTTNSSNYDPTLSQQKTPEYVADRLIIKFKDGVTENQINALDVHTDVLSAQTIQLTKAQIWHLAPSISVEDAIAKYGKSDLVDYVEPDYVIRLDPTEATSNKVHTTAISPQTTTPNDPSYPVLWGLNNTGQSSGVADADIDAPEAWDMQTGNPDLVIGVIDTGVDYNHPDLINNIWTNPGEIANDGIDNDSNGYVDDVHGWNFAYGNNNPMDDYGHGTHVSGTIAGKGNNGMGVTGVAWNAKIMPIKFLDDTGYGETSAAILALNYATANGVKITNNSWGGGGYSQALVDAISAAGQQGALFIAAAGNDSVNNDTSPHYPSSYDLANIIAVAATTRTDSLASFSNYGVTSVDLGAPGLDIYSTVPNNGYTTASGTSMATPHVSGAAALLWSQHPTWTAQQVKNTLLYTGDFTPALAGKVVAGRLNINNALLSDGNFPSITVSVDPASLQEDGTDNLTATFSRSGDVTNSLIINFSVAGTANTAAVGTDPADYSVLTSAGVTFNAVTKTGTVTFAAGASTSQVVIDPTADTLGEDQNETVVLTVNAGGSYISGSTATGTIVSEEVIPVFTNPASITIPSSGSATPYPSLIHVDGLSGYVSNVKVNLSGLSHIFSGEIDMFLLGPEGQKVMLMSDAGGSYSMSNVNLSFTDNVTTMLPSAQITSGTYHPTNYGTGDVFPAPAPTGPYPSLLSKFNGSRPNGDWQLFVYDDTGGDAGNIAGGWSLAIQTSDTPPSAIEVEASDTGWYNNTGYHSPTNTNYLVGDNVGTGSVYRNWLSFNLPTFPLPVASAKLQIKTYYYTSANASETYELHDVSTAVSTLTKGGSGLVTVYNDLADGTVYGSRNFTNADDNKTVTIDLNANLVDALNSKSGQAFALGGQLSTLDTLDNSEYVFGISGNDPTTDVQLLITYAEPETIPPTLSSFTPPDNAVDVPLDSNLVLTFNESVKAGSGNITLFNTMTNAVEKSISVTDTTQVSFASNTLTINPSTDLWAGNAYYVNIPVGAITDVFGNQYAGITDTSSYNFRTDALYLTEDDDTYTNGSKGELIAALAGDDLVYGNAGNDTVVGDTGDDTLYGGSGRDVLYANAFISPVEGDNDSNKLYGGSNKDVFFLGLSDNSVNGGGGSDTVTSEQLNNPVYPDPTVSTWQNTGSGMDKLISIENATGGLANDVLIGNALANSLGGAAGQDTLDGGLGNDSLIGGLGNDRYVFNLGYGKETIQDTDLTIGNNDSIVMGAGILPSGVAVSRTASQMLLTLDTNNQLRINWNTADGTKIEHVVFADGTSWDDTTLVNLTNQAPSATNLNQSIAYTEDTTAAITDIVISDPDGATNLFTATVTLASPAVGSLSVSSGSGETYNAATGAWSVVGTLTAVNTALAAVAFIPTTNSFANTSATVSISDGFAPVITGTLSFNGTAVNDAPVANNDTLAATEDTLITYSAAQLLSNDTDVENDTLSIVSVTSGKGGTAVLNNDGTVTFNPSSNFNGVADFTYQAKDNALTSNTATVTVNVAAVNDPPVVANPLNNQTAVEHTAFNYSVPSNSFSDVDVGDTLSYTASLANGSALPTWLTFNKANQIFSGTPNTAGTLALKVTASDSGSASVSSDFTLTIVADNDNTDFNGDKKSDLLWTHSDGSVAAMTLNGLGIISNAVVYNATAMDNGAWKAVDSRGDYNNDGKTDLLLWNSTTSSAKMALMNGTTIISDGLIDYAQNLTGWSIVDSTADYNNDGKSDILWWHSTTSTLYLALHNGRALLSGGNLFTNINDWAVIEGNADYNSDGKSDILMWNQSTSSAYMLTMNGLSIGTQAAITGKGSDWSIVDAQGDFNADGKSDILWRNATTGELWRYQMNGTTISNNAHVATVDNAWQIVSAHNDFNADGKSDILWKHSDGRVAIWLMNDTVHTANAEYGPYSGWTVKNADNDFNGDAKADLLWTKTDGSTYLFLMDGTSLINSAPIGPYDGWSPNNAANVSTDDLTVTLTGVADLALV